MPLFFPVNNNAVKINSSNSQVDVNVGESMTITAGNSFTVTAGSTSTIRIGPATNFLLGSAVNISLASTLSYTYGFSAAYGMAQTSTNVTNLQTATDSYQIQAGAYTPVQQAIIMEESKQVFYVLLATIVSMGAIALTVVNGLSNPTFIKDNAVPNSSADVARAACVTSITTVSMFIAQWGLTYLLAKSSEFLPVTNLLLNSTGITANIQTVAANKANLLMPDTIVPSAEIIMYASPDADLPTLTNRVNQAPVLGISPQLSEIVLTTNQINLSSITQPNGISTHNTQIIMNSANQTISLQSDSAAVIPGGSINIGENTAIYNPNGKITLFSESGSDLGDALLEIESGVKASLSCSISTNTGAIVATPTSVNIGVSTLGSGNAKFDSTGVTIHGTSINIGGAITILGSPAPNSSLNAVILDVTKNTTMQAELVTELELVKKELKLLQETMITVKQTAAAQTEMLKDAAIIKGTTKTMG